MPTTRSNGSNLPTRRPALTCCWMRRSPTISRMRPRRSPIPRAERGAGQSQAAPAPMALCSQTALCHQLGIDNGTGRLGRGGSLSAALSVPNLKGPLGHSLENGAPVTMHITTIALVLFVEFRPDAASIPVRGGGAICSVLRPTSRHVFRCHKVSAVRPPGKRLWSGQHECMAGTCRMSALRSAPCHQMTIPRTAPPAELT